MMSWRFRHYGAHHIGRPQRGDHTGKPQWETTMRHHNRRPPWETTGNLNGRPQWETTLGDHTGNSVERP
eukprot:4884250-Heterocapsa_arctica.AAC.1